MLYHLLFALRDQASVLNVTRYITFRTAVATLTALFLVLLLGPWMIERLRRLLPARIEGQDVLLEHALEESDDVITVFHDQLIGQHLARNQRQQQHGERRDALVCSHYFSPGK